MKPKVTPPDSPRGMLRDVVRVVETKAKSQRNDPKVKEMTTLLMAGRSAERADIVEEIDRRIAVAGGRRNADFRAKRLLGNLRMWIQERER